MLICHFMFLSEISSARWVIMGIAVKLAQSVIIHFLLSCLVFALEAVLNADPTFEPLYHLFHFFFPHLSVLWNMSADLFQFLGLFL